MDSSPSISRMNGNQNGSISRENERVRNLQDENAALQHEIENLKADLDTADRRLLHASEMIRDLKDENVALKQVKGILRDFWDLIPT